MSAEVSAMRRQWLEDASFIRGIALPSDGGGMAA
jgi:hypothetical protein